MRKKSNASPLSQPVLDDPETRQINRTKDVRVRAPGRTPGRTGDGGRLNRLESLPPGLQVGKQSCQITELRRKGGRGSCVGGGGIGGW